ncbi:ABC transporter substrate-binding protein [Phytohalomonas tamaricis]|uniref:ABC transporter substrate-binding protein n=1 Tax=Phytohalomonas tamaricis TaxID=2081032 RepID=UPI000D0B68AF|nr:ABC transporter substrate-binding protein [Phytohalomonas tamaricis]
MTTGVSFLRTALVLLLLLTCVNANATDNPAERIAVIDWGVAETVIALGITPLAVADTTGYRTWVDAPPLPEGTLNMGLRSQPNLERLNQLSPDLILTSAMFATDRERLARIAPTRSIDIYSADGAPYAHALAATREVARLTGHEEEGEALIACTENTLDTAREVLQAIDRPVYIIQFSDARHVRLFGHGSLIQAALDRMGLNNAWQGETNTWGFANVGIETLAQVPDAYIIVIAPMLGDTEQALRTSRIWQQLPAIQRGEVYYLPPVWIFGALPSFIRFTLLLQHALGAAVDSPIGSTAQCTTPLTPSVAATSGVPKESLAP